jgi:hypothetical protein
MEQGLERIYLVIFLISAVLSMIKFLKKPNWISFIVLFLTIIGSAFTISDLSATSKKLSYLQKLSLINDSLSRNIDSLGKSIDSLGKVNNNLSVNIKSAVNANGQLTSKTYSIVDKINHIDANIQEISKNTNDVSKEIKDMTSNGNATPNIVIYPTKPNSEYFYVSLVRFGKYLLQSVKITITDLQLLNDLGHPPSNKSDYALFERNYIIFNLSNERIIDSILIKSWTTYPLQRFTVNMITANGNYSELICLKLLKDSTVDYAFWKMDRFTNRTLDSTLPKSFLVNDKKTFDDVFFRP